jgi:hypothetical protein
MSRKKRTLDFYNQTNEEYFLKLKDFVNKYNDYYPEYNLLLNNYQNLTFDIIKKIQILTGIWSIYQKIFH